MKQNSIDWLIAEIQKLEIQITMDSKLKLMTAIEAAKQMHRQEIETAFNNALIPCKTNDYGTQGFNNSLDYYNQTFNK
jgi:hypothetical protein